MPAGFCRYRLNEVGENGRTDVFRSRGKEQLQEINSHVTGASIHLPYTKSGRDRPAVNVHKTADSEPYALTGLLIGACGTPRDMGVMGASALTILQLFQTFQRWPIHKTVCAGHVII